MWANHLRKNLLCGDHSTSETHHVHLIVFEIERKEGFRPAPESQGTTWDRLSQSSDTPIAEERIVDQNASWC